MNMFLLNGAAPLALLAAEGGSKLSVSGIVGTVAGWGAALLAAILIATVVKEGLQYIKGSGSVSLWGILGKVLVLILMLGFIMVARNYTKYQERAQGAGDTALDITEMLVNELTTGSGGTDTSGGGTGK